MNELNERQIALYSYMLNATNYVKEVNRFILMHDLDNYYERSKEHCSIANSHAYRTLRKDIEAINKSTAQYVILSVRKGGKMFGYKLANSGDEIIRQARRLQAAAFRKLVMASKLLHKDGNDGQVRFSPEMEAKEINATWQKNDITG